MMKSVRFQQVSRCQIARLLETFADGIPIKVVDVVYVSLLLDQLACYMLNLVAGQPI